MLESAWIFTGVVALLATVGAVISPDDGIAIPAGVMGFIAWGVWTFGALDVRVVGDSVTYSFTMSSVAFLGLTLALVPAYVALTGPVDIIGRFRRGDIDEL